MISVKSEILWYGYNESKELVTGDGRIGREERKLRKPAETVQQEG